MKKKLFVFAIILIIGFIANSCDGEQENKSSCECNPKEHNEGENCCKSNDCNCLIILNCDCPEDTLHITGEICRGPLNCECGVAYSKLSNGIYLTMDKSIVNPVVVKENIEIVLFEWLLVHENIAYNIIINNVYEIRVLIGYGEYTNYNILRNEKYVVLMDENVDNMNLYNKLCDIAVEIHGGQWW